MDQIQKDITVVENVMAKLNAILAKNATISTGGSLDIDPNDESLIASLVQENNYSFIAPQIKTFSDELGALGALTDPEDFLDPKFLALVSGLDANTTNAFKKEFANGLIDEVKNQFVVVKANIGKLSPPTRQLPVSTAMLIINQCINEINQLLVLLEKIDQRYVDQINNKSDIFEINNYNLNPRQYVVTGQTGRLQIPYSDIKKQLDYFNLTRLATAPGGSPNNIQVLTGATIKNKLEPFLRSIVTDIETSLPGLLDTYLNQIQFTQTGGAGIDSMRIATANILRRKKLLLEANELLKLYTTKLANLKLSLNQLQQQQNQLQPKTKSSIPVDYFNPFVTFLQYNIGNITPYDDELLRYCESIGLSKNVILAIYFAQRREDIQQIMELNYPQYSYSILNILRLKKASAHYKFRMNYDMRSEQQLALLSEKKILY